MSSEINLPAGPHLAGGELASAGSETTFLFGGRTYRAFISYSHADSKWATWLVRRLENFKVPERFQGLKAPIGKVGARIAPVFRDRDELPTTSDLGETIRTALRQSATLIVICSPSSAKSRWVQEEILAFKRMGGSAKVFAFIVGGEPKAAGTSEDCFPPALRSEIGADGELSAKPAEHVAADARPQGDGREDALVRLVSGLLGVGFDELRQREQARRVRRLTMIATGSALGMAVTLGLAIVAWQARNEAVLARNDAQRRLERGEDLVAFMLGDLHAQLEKIGRLEVLQAVPKEAMAYFAALEVRDLTDNSLLRQAMALRQIGEIRFAQTSYPEAMRAFMTAYERSAALVARHPRDGAMLFERGQSEFWIGNTHRKLGDRLAVTEWFTRYRDTAAALVAIDSTKPEWQRELTYGLHNLAVADFDNDQLAPARRGFLAELEALKPVLAAAPTDLTLQFEIVQAGSWLGTIAERSGDFREAATRFAEQAAQLDVIARADAKTARWRQRLADALGLHASVLALLGDRAASMASRVRAKALLDGLVKDDPQNRGWLRSLLQFRLKEAELVRAEGDIGAALTLVDDTRQKLDTLLAAAPKDPELLARLANACRMQAELRVQTGRSGATEAVARAIEITEGLAADPKAGESVIGECASSHVVAGLLAAQSGESSAAREHWRRAQALVAPRVAGTNHWRILVPAAHALWWLGEREASRAIMARLRQFGYQPLQPWPDGAESL